MAGTRKKKMGRKKTRKNRKGGYFIPGRVISLAPPPPPPQAPPIIHVQENKRNNNYFMRLFKNLTNRKTRKGNNLTPNERKWNEWFKKQGRRFLLASAPPASAPPASAPPVNQPATNLQPGETEVFKMTPYSFFEGKCYKRSGPNEIRKTGTEPNIRYFSKNVEYLGTYTGRGSDGYVGEGSQTESKFLSEEGNIIGKSDYNVSDDYFIEVDCNDHNNHLTQFKRRGTSV